MISTGHGMYYLGPDVPGVCHRARQPANVRRSALPYAPELQEKILEGRAALVSISMPARDEIIEIGNSFPIDTAASGLAILSTYVESECV